MQKSKYQKQQTTAEHLNLRNFDVTARTNMVALTQDQVSSTTRDFGTVLYMATSQKPVAESYIFRRSTIQNTFLSYKNAKHVI